MNNTDSFNERRNNNNDNFKEMNFKEMNILHVVDSSGIYGKEKVIISLLNHFKDSQVKNVSMVKDFDNDKEVIEKCSILKDKEIYDYEIIHCHDFKSSVMTFYWLASSGKWLYKKRPKLIRTLHGFTSVKRFSKRNLYKLIDRFILCHLFDKVISVSGEGPNVILNGIPVSNDKKVSEVSKEILNFCKEGIIIGSVGRLAKEKNYLALLESLIVLNNPSIKLLIIGEGPERKILETFIAEHNLQSQVKLLGFVSNPQDIIKLVDVYIQPSKTEGTPIAVLEAASLGKMLVLTNVGGMKTFIEQKSAVNIPTTTIGIAEVIKNINSNSEIKRTSTNRRSETRLGGRRISDRAKEFFFTNYTEEKMIEAYHQAYMNL